MDASAWYDVGLSATPLDIAGITNSVTVAETGATTSFIGTTRSSFEGKGVLRLEYEAYAPMALKELVTLCEGARQRWPDVARVAVWHRTGVVPVTEASVVIAVSAAHRRAALEAVAWAIDELKVRVPIWKREVYEDGSAWKANPESVTGVSASGPGAGTA